MPDAPAATFAFDTADSALENSNAGVENAWKLHGPWVLPFAGRAHFDPGLDGWVGFSRDDRGRLCACEVSDGSNDDGQCPAWKLGKERYFAEGSVEKHVGASLVHVGGRRSRRFCVAESFHLDDDDGSARDEMDEDDVSQHTGGRGCWIRLTTFSLRFDMRGDLTTGSTRHVRCTKRLEQLPSKCSGTSWRFGCK